MRQYTVVEPLTAIVPSAVRTILRQGPMSPGKLKLAWRVAVGPALDRATRVALLDDGSIEVAAADAAWRREVKRSQAEILSRLQALIGEHSPTKLRIVSRPSER
jgi:predicted nucleic acid-binding Zn ribbon protein